MQYEDKSFSQMREDLYKSYKSQILPLLKIQESKDKTSWFFAKMIIFIYFFFWCFFLFYALTHIDYSLFEYRRHGDYYILLFFVTAILPLWCLGLFGEFEYNKNKKQIMEIICRCIGNLKWSRSFYRNWKFFKTPHILPNKGSIFFDDIFQGSYKNIKFEIIETKCSAKLINGEHFMFKGILVKFDTNRRFKGLTIIRRKSDRLLDLLYPLKNLRFIEFDNEIFNKKFDVLTDNEYEARELITEDFMEKIQKIRLAFQAYMVRCAFYDSSFILAIDTENLFTLRPPNQRDKDFECYEQIFEELCSIMGIIDHFGLYEGVWL